MDDIDRIVRGFGREREELGMSWNDYLCYVLEVDKDEVNTDELTHLSAVVARSVDTVTEGDDA